MSNPPSTWRPLAWGYDPQNAPDPPEEDEEEMEIQTRNTEGELRYFSTFAEAWQHRLVDTSVWKISFSIQTGERIRLVKGSTDEFYLEQIDLGGSNES